MEIKFSFYIGIKMILNYDTSAALTRKNKS